MGTVRNTKAPSVEPNDADSGCVQLLCRVFVAWWFRPPKTSYSSFGNTIKTSLSSESSESSEPSESESSTHHQTIIKPSSSSSPSSSSTITPGKFKISRN